MAFVFILIIYLTGGHSRDAYAYFSSSLVKNFQGLSRNNGGMDVTSQLVGANITKGCKFQNYRQLRSTLP